MKKALLTFVLVIGVILPAAAGMWTLVDQQFSGSKWYCTYKLDNTTIRSTIESSMPCQGAIFQQ
jgi:hypothetical protein